MSCKFRSLVLLTCLLFSPLRPVDATVSADAQSALSALEQTGGYTDGLPEMVTPAPGATRIYFLRSGSTDTVRSLFMLDTSTGITQKILDPIELGLSRKGLTSFQLSTNGKEILIPYVGKILILRVLDRRLLIFAGDGYVDPVLSPNGKMVAAVKQNNIVVVEVATGHVTQLTNSGTSFVTNGLPDLIAEREYGRSRGLWWSPDSQSIAYEHVDTNPVEQVNLVNLVHPDQLAQTVHYPFAGTPNAVVRFGIVPAAGGSTVWANYDIQELPYIVRAVWRFAKAPLTIVLQSRDQKEEQVLSVDPSTGDTSQLIKETSAAWVSAAPDAVHQSADSTPYWLSDGSGFLWLSNDSGDWQIELHTAKGSLVKDLTPVGLHVRSIDDVDESKGAITFEAGPDPKSCQIYQTDFRADPSTLLSHTDGLHYAAFSSDHSVYADTYSLLDDEVGTDIFSTSTGFRAARIPSAAVNPSSPPNVKFFQVGGGQAMDAAVILPTKFNSQAQYPALLSESDTFGSSAVTSGIHRYLDLQWYADQGFIVVLIDGRGAPDRSRASEEALKYSIATVPLSDQIAGLSLLAKDVPQIDLSRVAIIGEDVGGYLAAMGTIRHPDVFACGVAISPIVDWRLEDNAIAEKYLDSTQVDPVGYKSANVLTYAATLSKPLLIVQNSVQNSISLTSSLRLAELLFQNEKPFTFLPISGEFGPGGDPVDRISFHLAVLNYLAEQLHP